MLPHRRDRSPSPTCASQLGVSRRTLQYSFKEVLGINPVRVPARDALERRAPRPQGRRDARRVGAGHRRANWGFWHLGHFVTEYKQMFGELPSETLRRTRRAPA